jgi:hypothetical protein
VAAVVAEVAVVAAVVVVAAAAEPLFGVVLSSVAILSSTDKFPPCCRMEQYSDSLRRSSG